MLIIIVKYGYLVLDKLHQLRGDFMRRFNIEVTDSFYLRIERILSYIDGKVSNKDLASSAFMRLESTLRQQASGRKIIAVDPRVTIPNSVEFNDNLAIKRTETV
ncbi:MAG: hypothetical protein A3E93_02340 [Candidatus Zambryskibacteria bacterium RIFCSPHIGHO2_12_FULL_43_12b]|nr:MAG: hypothetical protein A3E93_02340 [Candidatus Zambryskibacteria bacterium RIFCSPHIGHO2_12_FULL_43_12b]